MPLDSSFIIAHDLTLFIECIVILYYMKHVFIDYFSRVNVVSYYLY